MLQFNAPDVVSFVFICFEVRFEREGEPSQLAAVDFFVSTVDPLKEPPLITANTVLSILAVDYPVDKVSCYVSDDGAAMLTFESLVETADFARKWVPFCKKFSIEPRAPEFYFSQKIDYLKDKVQPSFVKERRAMKVRTSNFLFTFCFLFVSHSHELGDLTSVGEENKAFLIWVWKPHPPSSSGLELLSDLLYLYLKYII